MSRDPRGYECWGCHKFFRTATDHAIHTASCRGLGGPVAGPVHCWACAHPIDLRDGTVCPSCGRDYAEGDPSAAEVARAAQEGKR